MSAFLTTEAGPVKAWGDKLMRETRWGRFRGITGTNARGLPHWEPVLVCDSDLLAGMMLMAWGGAIPAPP